MSWKLDPETAEVLTASETLVTGLGGGKVAKRPRHSLEMMALFDRCRSLLGAIHLLLDRGFVHEAVILGRPLFTDSLALAEYAASDERRRVGLVVGRWLASLADAEGLFRDMGSRGEDVSEALAGLHGRRKELEAYARRHGAGTKAWRPDDHAKALALKHGRADEYTALLVTHHFVHGGMGAVAERYTKVSDDTVEVGGPAVNRGAWVRSAGLFAAFSTLHGARATCRAFEWEEPVEIEQLLHRIEALAEAESG